MKKLEELRREWRLTDESDTIALPWGRGSPDFHRSLVRPPNENLGPCTGLLSLRLALYGVPHGFSSASHRGECHQLGRYWPLTTRSPAARAPRFNFVMLIVSSAPPGA
ncbi:hypothetical protein AMTR_s00063p00208440 [Amborella trichopoda]|uniref:Uncharacterized protein n=1 Tax=Amborella trichopoda TaxID=13333 RepID=U5D4F1_AMBTC|nr:hypothetical protein AMTR_s00063p00208440 [Amborella trichopoda]